MGLGDHLGNVLATVLDRKTGQVSSSVPTLYDHYLADVETAQDFYPFGMPMPDRTINGESSRFGYNGQEKVNEISGVGNHNTALFWEYDTRIARRWNLDPVDQINISNYAANALNPIWFKDPLGNKNDKDVKSNPNAPSNQGGTEKFHNARMASGEQYQSSGLVTSKNNFEKTGISMDMSAESIDYDKNYPVLGGALDNFTFSAKTDYISTRSSIETVLTDDGAKTYYDRKPYNFDIGFEGGVGKGNMGIRKGSTSLAVEGSWLSVKSESIFKTSSSGFNVKAEAGAYFAQAEVVLHTSLIVNY